MSIFICGDIMPGGVLPYQKQYIDDTVLKYLQKFDIRIGTLEAAIGTGLQYDQTKMRGTKNIVYARDEDFFRVVDLGFNVVSLANNHIYDLGEEGLKNTIRLLDQNGIKHCGAGINIKEASKPAVIQYHGKSIAILACCMYGNKYLGHVELAGQNKSGVNPLDIETIISDIKYCKQKYDYVLVMPHWGIEYQYFPTIECKQLAYKMIDAGADCIIGSHAHNIQPMIKYQGKWIYFCMGNFMFPDYYMCPPRPIWYPESSYDRTTIKKEFGYPKDIQEPTTSVWNGRSRIGIVSELDIKNNVIKCVYHLTCLTDKNVVKFYDCFNKYMKQFRLWWMGIVIKSNFFENFVRCYDSKYNFPRKALHYISRKLKINYDVKVNL